MKLIDTNIIVYALGGAHVYRESSREILDRVPRGELDATINVEAIQELIHYYHARRPPSRAVTIVVDLMRTFPIPLGIDASTVTLALNILDAHTHLQSRDAFHVATVFQHNLEGIISADRGFDNIPGLTRFDPKELVA